VSDPNNDPRVSYETVHDCLCGAALSPGPVWGWDICPACGTWVNSRRPTIESLPAVYGPGYWTTTQELVNCPPLETRFEADMLDRIPAYLSAIVPHLTPGARVAEVGCGNGRLIHELKRLGFDAVGTEFSADVIARVRKLTDVPILQGGVERLEPGSCDAVISIDVLEHAHDPRAFLASHARVIRKGGLLMVHTPVHARPNDPYTYSVGILWKLYHLYLFSRSLLERLFDEAGFDVVSNAVAVFGWPVYLLRKR
jgi:SAM-dependent methyltransferase